jgi:hypothetical protein
MQSPDLVKKYRVFKFNVFELFKSISNHLNDLFQLLNVGGIVPQACMTAEFPIQQVCLNLQDFSSAYRFVSWTPKVL